MQLSNILPYYNLNVSTTTVEPINNGLINSTVKLIGLNGEAFVLQKINTEVFKKPKLIQENIDSLSIYFKTNYPEYLFTAPVVSVNGTTMVEVDSNYFRLYPFIKNTHSKNEVGNSNQAYEAAYQFGKFTSQLSGFDVEKLHTIIPDFHNLQLRYQQFIQAIKSGNSSRMEIAKTEIDFLLQQQNIVQQYNAIIVSKACRIRVTHHDTKISNVLFNDKDKAVCVIDLDTVMPGYFMSDAGDMMRTYLCPLNEESINFEAIEIRRDVFEAIVNGYTEAMQNHLSNQEKEHIFFSGQFMIYMQALRFITDYLNNDVYYPVTYEDHNFNRAKNQIELFKKYSQLRS